MLAEGLAGGVPKDPGEMNWLFELTEKWRLATDAGGLPIADFVAALFPSKTEPEMVGFDAQELFRRCFDGALGKRFSRKLICSMLLVALWAHRPDAPCWCDGKMQLAPEGQTQLAQIGQPVSSRAKRKQQPGWLHQTQQPQKKTELWTWAR